MLKKLILSSCLVLLASTAFAYSSTVSYDNSTSWNTNALTGYATDGTMMDGMTVRANFADGSTQTAIWGHSGATGSASAANFSLQETGDTFGGLWTLSSTLLLHSLQIDAGTGNTVFDAIMDPTLSDGSARGWPFQISSASNNLNISAIYSGRVSVNNVFTNPSDLYRSLTLVFNGGFGANDYLNFITDTDNLKYAGDINPAVPEPSTMLLLGGGLAGLAFWRRKQSK